MKVLFNQKLTDGIIKTVRSSREKYGPQLCCEFITKSPERFVSIMVNNVSKWERELVGIFLVRGSQCRLFGITSSELQDILYKAISTQEVIVICDFMLTGGCTVDFTPHEEDESEILFTAWGKYESDTMDIAGLFEDAVIFRGN